jgi:hypothetical protein
VNFRVEITIDVDMPGCKTPDIAGTTITGIVAGSIFRPIETFVKDWELRGYEAHEIEKLDKPEAAP